MFSFFYAGYMLSHLRYSMVNFVLLKVTTLILISIRNYAHIDSATFTQILNIHIYSTRSDASVR